MSDILPNGGFSGYENYCPKCKKVIKVNAQGNELGKHICITTSPDIKK